MILSNDDPRADGDEVEEGKHFAVPQPDAAAGGGLANEVLGVGPVEVYVATVGIGVFVIQSVKPEDPGEDGVVCPFAVPDSAWAAALKAGVDGCPFANALAHDEVPCRGAMRSFLESDSVRGGGDGGGEGTAALVIEELESLIGNRNLDHGAVIAGSGGLGKNIRGWGGSVDEPDTRAFSGAIIHPRR